MGVGDRVCVCGKQHGAQRRVIRERAQTTTRKPQIHTCQQGARKHTPHTRATHAAHTHTTPPMQRKHTSRFKAALAASTIAQRRTYCVTSVRSTGARRGLGMVREIMGSVNTCRERAAQHASAITKHSPFKVSGARDVAARTHPCKRRVRLRNSLGAQNRDPHPHPAHTPHAARGTAAECGPYPC
jgi:hypothetical protein